MRARQNVSGNTTSKYLYGRVGSQQQHMNTHQKKACVQLCYGQLVHEMALVGLTLDLADTGTQLF